MTIQECYAVMEGDYEEVKARLMGKDELILRFIRKFADSPVYNDLQAALEAGDLKEAFAQSHTLKGTAGNLSLKKLVASDSALCEELRKENPDPAEVERLNAQVKLDYQQVMDGIAQLSE